jgi:hypothetical protein
MRRLLAVALAPLILLAGCAQTDSLLFHGAFADAHARSASARAHRAEVAACGHGPGSEWCLAAADDSDLARLYPGRSPHPVLGPGVIVYDESQCAGTFAHGLCRGQSRPRTSLEPVCHGQIIDGRCAGPIF